jgi:short-subunit dehydrogenase
MESMRNRLTRHGVNVLTIKPGFVKTNMLAGVKKAPFAISAEASADLIYKAMRSGRKQVVYVPGIWRWIMLVIRHIPSFIFRRLNF